MIPAKWFHLRTLTLCVPNVTMSIGVVRHQRSALTPARPIVPRCGARYPGVRAFGSL
jgi:hypothetical protein